MKTRPQLVDELHEGLEALAQERQGRATLPRIRTAPPPLAAPFDAQDTGSWRRLDMSRPAYVPCPPDGPSPGPA